MLYVVFARRRQSAVRHERDHYTHVWHTRDDEEIWEPILPWKVPLAKMVHAVNTGRSQALPGSADITHTWWKLPRDSAVSHSSVNNLLK